MLSKILIEPRYKVLDFSKIGEVIRLRREARGLSRKDFAAMLGIKTSYLFKIEHGLKTNMKLALVMNICYSLGITNIFDFLDKQEYTTESNIDSEFRSNHDNLIAIEKMNNDLEKINLVLGKSLFTIENRIIDDNTSVEGIIRSLRHNHQISKDKDFEKRSFII